MSVHCPECGGPLAMCPRPDAKWTIRIAGQLVTMPLPETIEVLSCAKCGEYLMNEAMETAVEEALLASIAERK